MRILVVGGDIAGLLTALYLRQLGDAVTVVFHRQEATLTPAPPLIFSSSGLWGTHRSAWSVFDALLKGRGNFRFGDCTVSQLPWLLRSAAYRFGDQAVNLSRRTLTMARQSHQNYIQTRSAIGLLPCPQSINQLIIGEHSFVSSRENECQAFCHSTNEKRIVFGEHGKENWRSSTVLDLACKHQDAVYTEAVMVANTVNVVAALRHHLSCLGVRFIFYHQIDHVENVSREIQKVTLRGPMNRIEEIDTDLVVATSAEAAWPLLNSVSVAPDLGSISQSILRVKLHESNSTATHIYDRQSGVEITQTSDDVWIHGPVWLGEPKMPRSIETTELLKSMEKYFGTQYSIPEVELEYRNHWVFPDGLPLVGQTSTYNLFLNLGYHSASAALAFDLTSALKKLIEHALHADSAGLVKK